MNDDGVPKSKLVEWVDASITRQEQYAQDLTKHITELYSSLDTLRQDNKEINQKLEQANVTIADLREERGASREREKLFEKYRQQLSHWLWYRDIAYCVLFVAGLIPFLLQNFLSLIGINVLQISLAIVSLVLFIFSWRGSRNVQVTYEE
ncbi:MAG: hypothetical protein LBH59_01930 [Planctomycetaceae bacterium]|jgi:hypothetical protein|nr:hypothetical protein [Planctomycetaceae bacterium]